MPECLNPGTANPDIAGLGIIIAFAVQGGISVVLATALALMTTGSMFQAFPIRQAASEVVTELLHSPNINVAEVVQLARDFGVSSTNTMQNTSLPVAKQLKKIISEVRRGNYDQAALSGNGLFNWDARGVSLVPGFTRMILIEGPRVAFSQARRLAYLQGVARRPGGTHAPSADVEIVNGILVAVSDAQLISGISLLVAALVIHRSLSLYHFHIIYDMTNFTAVSFIAAYSNIFLRGRRGYIRRTCAGILFAALYLAFAVLFGRALRSWDWNTPGACYNTRLLATPSASHPYVDLIYLGVTCFFMFCSCALPVYVLLFNTFGNVKQAREYAQIVLVLSFMQYPLHLYSVVALRVSNRGLLEGDSEDSWGFGQVVALVLLGAVLVQCVYGVFGEFGRFCTYYSAVSLTCRVYSLVSEAREKFWRYISTNLENEEILGLAILSLLAVPRTCLQTGNFRSRFETVRVTQSAFPLPRQLRGTVRAASILARSLSCCRPSARSQPRPRARQSTSSIGGVGRIKFAINDQQHTRDTIRAPNRNGGSLLLHKVVHGPVKVCVRAFQTRQSSPLEIKIPRTPHLNTHWEYCPWASWSPPGRKWSPSNSDADKSSTQRRRQSHASRNTSTRGETRSSARHGRFSTRARCRRMIPEGKRMSRRIGRRRGRIRTRCTRLTRNG
ncbi:hypothetical protein QBC39DRAFT_351297 [Podospora conica]|nr:hypothetical protein QBC39DRAFT_351297 [Schizothecium conicum]